MSGWEMPEETPGPESILPITPTEIPISGNSGTVNVLTKQFQNSSFLFTNSWHEIGAYDLPAMIDYVLKVTGEQQVVYIGHSQGTTSFFVMGSVRPEYNDKIKLAIALAPIGYMSNMTNPFFKVLSLFHNSLEVSKLILLVIIYLI